MPDTPDFRIECPVCGTSYLNSRMKIKVGPREKAIAWCTTCHTGLDITADHITTVTQPPRSWRHFWLLQPATTETKVVATVKVRK